MKFYFLLIIFLVLFNLSCDDESSCKTGIPEWCDRADLDPTYDPVCGCDGVTYINAGYAQCVGGIMEYSEGECK